MHVLLYIYMLQIYIAVFSSYFAGGDFFLGWIFSMSFHVTVVFVGHLGVGSWGVSSWALSLEPNDARKP